MKKPRFMRVRALRAAPGSEGHPAAARALAWWARHRGAGHRVTLRVRGRRAQLRCSCGGMSVATREEDENEFG